MIFLNFVWLWWRKPLPHKKQTLYLRDANFGDRIKKLGKINSVLKLELHIISLKFSHAALISFAYPGKACTGGWPTRSGGWEDSCFHIGSPPNNEQWQVSPELQIVAVGGDPAWTLQLWACLGISLDFPSLFLKLLLIQMLHHGLAISKDHCRK